MTGYARVNGGDVTHAWTWEIKSVNGRGLDLRVRVPAGYDSLDIAARDLAARSLKRGNVQITLTVTQLADPQALHVNTAHLDRLLAGCADLATKYPQVAMPSWDGLLALRGVLEAGEDTGSTEDTGARNQREAALRGDLVTALDALTSMRGGEGERIAATLAGQLDTMAALTAKAEALAVMRPEAQRDRLKALINEILDTDAGLSEERLAQEVALIVVKGDIREELDRLSAHVAAAREMLRSGGAQGRKLDFLSQEFNREANTLCSKAQDLSLTGIGLDLKVVIDQFREQVQNIE